MNDYDYIFVAGNPGLDSETAFNYISQKKVWDFLHSSTPSYARDLKPGHVILFYMPQNSSFFATAVLDSEYMDEYNEVEKVVKLKDINEIDIKVDNPKNDYLIGKGADKIFIVPHPKNLHKKKVRKK